MVVKVTVKQRSTAPSRSERPAGASRCGDEGCGLLLTRLARAANRSLAGALDEVGLRAQQFAVLHRLADAGPASQAELAAALRVHASNLVRLLDEMEDAGLIGRRRDPADRRRQVVILTRAGAARLRKAERIAAETERELLAPLDQAERRQLHGLLERLAGHACRRSC